MTLPPDEIVCWCFSHRVADVQADARTHGRSTIAAEVLAACRGGRARCAETNPAGTCCLGRLRAIAGQTVQAGCCGEAPDDR